MKERHFKSSDICENVACCVVLMAEGVGSQKGKRSPEETVEEGEKNFSLSHEGDKLW